MKRNGEFIYEMSAFRSIRRFGNMVPNAQMTNLAEHTFRVMRMAWMIQRMEGKGDLGKILKMALSHDIPESRTGDFTMINKKYSTRDEVAAMKDIIADTVFDEEMVQLLEEEKKRESIEAQIVKDADMIDQFLECAEKSYDGMLLLKDWKGVMDKLYASLYTESARTLRKQIESTNPRQRHEQFF